MASNLYLSASIDFGTTHSGCAYSFGHTFKQKPSDVYVVKWNGDRDIKAPTCVLFNPDGECDSFGFEAENSYAELDDSSGWSFFREFKMYMYNDQAGIPADHLKLCLEPEAAAVYTMSIPLASVRRLNIGFGKFTHGEKHIVIDAGGGTVDITAHEINTDGTMKQIHMANGGDLGGAKVDEQFKSLLSDLTSADTMKEFARRDRCGFNDLFRSFTHLKHTIHDGRSDSKTLMLPQSLYAACKKVLGIGLATAIDEYISNATTDDKRLNINCAITVTGDNRLKFHRKMIIGMIEGQAQAIAHKTKEVLRNVMNIHTIVMAGGFSKSRILQEHVKALFPDTTSFIVLEDSDSSVMKGAVIFGHDPGVITSRICRYTYGVGVSRWFDPTKHDDSKKRKDESGLFRCYDLFSKHVTIGQTVEVGKPQASSRISMANANATSMTLEIYLSTESNPTYITDPGCRLIGAITLDMPDTTKGRDRTANVQMTFSNTELKVHVTDADTGNDVKAFYNFL